MSMKINKIEPFYKGLKQTRTEVFMKILLKICYLPGILDKEKKTITFKFWSRPTVIHISIYLMLYLILHFINSYLSFPVEKFKELVETHSFVEFASQVSFVLAFEATFFPILIFKNFDEITMDFFSRLAVTILRASSLLILCTNVICVTRFVL